MRPIKNYDEVKKELAEMLETFQRECKTYQTDVYIYYDKTTRKATLDTFANVGGRSWLDDDHIVLYTDNQHDEREREDVFRDIDELADAIGMTAEDLEAAVRTDADLDDDDEVDWLDAVDYIKSKEDLWDRLVESALDFAKENGFNPEEEAERILYDFIHEEDDDYYDDEPEKEASKSEAIKKIRSISGLSQKAFALKYGIPARTIENWESGEREMPDYVLDLLEKAVWEDKDQTYLTWAVFEQSETDEWITPCESKAKAIEEGEDLFNRLTSQEKKHRKVFVGLANLDENGDSRELEDGTIDADVREVAKEWI